MAATSKTLGEFNQIQDVLGVAKYLKAMVEVRTWVRLASRAALASERREAEASGANCAR